MVYSHQRQVFRWGQVALAPVVLAPQRFDRFVQVLKGLAVGVPDAVELFQGIHTCLLSAPVSTTGAFLLSRGFPLDNYDYTIRAHVYQLAKCQNLHTFICVYCILAHVLS